MSVFAWADQGKHCMSIDSSRSDSSASMSVSQILAVIHFDGVMSLSSGDWLSIPAKTCGLKDLDD